MTLSLSSDFRQQTFLVTTANNVTSDAVVEDADVVDSSDLADSSTNLGDSVSKTSSNTSSSNTSSSNTSSSNTSSSSTLSEDEGIASGSNSSAKSDLADSPEHETSKDVSPVKGAASEMPGNSIETDEKLPIKMLNDRILVKLNGPDRDRTSTGGILIPATAQVGKRLTWAEVVAAGPTVRSMELGDRVLFNPEDRYEVDVGGKEYIILRERDIHAVAAKRLDDSHTGLYL